MLLLSDRALIEHFKSIKQPLPISLSAIRKDRITGKYGGIPHRKVASLALYNPDEVAAHFAGLPIVQPQRHPALSAVKPAGVGRAGRPNKAESVEAARRGITVPELRAQSVLPGVQQ